jgi:NDP-sugar pyrophosphorylase family protein
MKVVFLCGGSGKRMFPITEDKFLLDFLGKPLLGHQIEMARASGLTDFLVIGNPGNIARIEQITQEIAGAKIALALQKEPLGIADALTTAAPFLQGEVLIINPNDVFQGSAYAEIIGEMKKASASSYMLGYHVKEYFPGGYLQVDSRNELVHIVEKPKPGDEPSNLVNILIHLHNNPEKLLDYIAAVQTVKDDVYECALDNMVGEGHKIKVIPYGDFWAPIKYPWHIFRVMEHFLDNAEPYISPEAHISEKATIEGKVILRANVRVLENAVIRGPVYIGANSVIGNSALVRDYSHIGANSVVGYSTEVKHSYVGDNCWFHSNYIGDSIIDHDCSFGAGTVLANFRLDDASLMPGVRVGPNSFVGPQVCLNQDLEANKIVLLESRCQLRDNEARLDEGKRQELLRKLEK